MSIAKNFNLENFSGTFYSGRTGPKTPQGKAIAARNATSHGLFARDIVLPQLGEDPAGYTALYNQFCEQLDPRNLLERHYVEAIAAASWRLRRLHRWQAQVYEDLTLTEDERLDKLDRVLRHETALNRQIDKSVRLLGRDVPLLFEGRARKQALADLEQTERSCRLDASVEQDVSARTRDNLQFGSLPSDFDKSCLDNTPAPDPPAPPAPAPAVPDAVGSTAQRKAQNCQNEMVPSDEVLGPEDPLAPNSGGVREESPIGGLLAAPSSPLAPSSPIAPSSPNPTPSASNSGSPELGQGGLSS